jgi:hypothetical protein
MLESRKAAGLAKLAGSITKLDQHDDLITKDPFWLRLALHNGAILRFPIECSILSCVASFPMCLEEQDFEYFFQLTRNLDDEKLSNLDRYYRNQRTQELTSVDDELHGIVQSEIKRRRKLKVQSLMSKLMLSSHRKSLVDFAKGQLIRCRVRSSAAN